MSVLDKMISKFPFGDPVVNGLAFLNPKSRGDQPSHVVTTNAKRLSGLVATDKYSMLEQEFSYHQVMHQNDMSIYILTKTR